MAHGKGGALACSGRCRQATLVVGLETRVILIRTGETSWHEQDRLVGQRDPSLSATGQAQAEKAAALLTRLSVTELLSSPLQRAVQTAQIIGKQCDIDMARDQRLSALSWGAWEGQTNEALHEDPLFQRFLARPTDVRPPGGEGIEVARRRAVAAIEQALGDAASGDALAVVTHSTVIRMVLGHYLGAPVHSFQRMYVAPASLSIISFGHGQAARMVALNWCDDLKRTVQIP